MPNLKAAKKRVRVSLRNHLRNLSAHRTVHQAIKSADRAIREKKADAEKMVQEALRVIDKAWQRGILHRNTASRKKSRLVHRLRLTPPVEA